MSNYENKFDWCHFWKFESLDEMMTETIAGVNAHKARHSPFARDIQSTMSNDSSWVGRSIYSAEHARELSNKVWEPGLSAIERMITAVESTELPRPLNIRRRSSWSEDSGDELCLDRLRAGQAFWRTTSRQASPGPSNITILAGLGAKGSWDWETILWRGAAAIVLTHILEAAGYRVELWGARLSQSTFYEGQEGEHSAFAVKLKDLSSPLDISTLTNACSGWFYRSLGLAQHGMLPNGRIQGGYGSTCSLMTLQNWVAAPSDKVIISESVFSELSATAWVRNQLDLFLNPPAVEIEETSSNTNADTSSNASDEPRKPLKKVKLEGENHRRR